MMADTTGFLVTEKLVKRFDEAVAVDEVSLSIGKGEIFALLGSSGCGKSTLLRMIAGLEEISDGNLFIGDRRVNDVPPNERDIAMVFQNYALYPHMTVYENMAFGLKLHNMPKADIRERVTAAARLLEIETSSTASRRICRAGSGNAWPSAGPLSGTRRFFCLMSH